MKHSKVWRILAAVLLSAITIVSAPAAPALADPAIVLSQNQGAIGQVIRISGTGFVSTNVSRGVHLHFGRYPTSTTSNITMEYSTNIYKRVETFELLSNGTFSGNFTVPAKLDSGTTTEDVSRNTYYIYATYWWPPSQNFTGLNDLTILLIIPFNVVSAEASVQPTSGPVGTEITISGNYFGFSENINFTYDALAANVTGDRDTDSNGAFGPTRLKIPPGAAGSHQLLISGATSGLIVQSGFSITPAISLSSNSNAAGTMIILTGTGFAANSDITNKFGDAPVTSARTDATGSFGTAIPVPAKPPAAYNVTSTDASGNSATTTFTVTASGVTIQPTGGNPGTQVDVKGTGFVAGRKANITFNGANVATAAINQQGSFNATFTAPELKTGEYLVKASDGTNNSTAVFTILLTVDVSPKTSTSSPGYVGSNITVQGEGGIPGNAVIITYDGKEMGQTTVRSDRTFSYTITAPASKPGEPREHTILATIGTDVKQFSFVMESAYPASPATLKPETRARAASTVTFDWEDVTDESGLSYALQIATDKEFKTGSIVREKTGLEASDYTLTKDEKLKSLDKGEPYYWRVKADDNAGNAGAWSATGSFYVGISLKFPTPVVYLLIGAGALALVIFAFWLGRRTSYY